MAFNIQDLLEQNRRELLDLSTRNRLLSIPVNSRSASVIHLRDEHTAAVYRLLIEDKKTATFVHGIKDPEEDLLGDGNDATHLSQLDNSADPAPDPVLRRSDSRLLTALSPGGLQRRLLKLHTDARTAIEEQGVNILFLSLGQLKWFESDSSDEARFAPLILIPVELTRAKALDRFHLLALEEDLQENLSLSEKMRTDFGLDLPPIPEGDDFDPVAYIEAVAKSVASQKRWEVLPDAMTLGFFSFAKLLMYRDLDPASWSRGELLLDHPLVAGLLLDGFPASEALIPKNTQLDDLIPVQSLNHVVEADSSQTRVIENVLNGHNLVIQGPPGTGKSQSITNIIATAVLAGKRVLFVAEKLVALNVVKDRLKRVQLGDLCLELHSNKSSKRAVLQEIKRTWELGRPVDLPDESGINRLAARRTQLNQHVAALHTPLGSCGHSPFSLLGELAALCDRGGAAADLVLPGLDAWDAAAIHDRRALAAAIAERCAQIGPPSANPWRGVRRTAVLRLDREQVLAQLDSARERLSLLRSTAGRLAKATSLVPGTTLAEIATLAHIGRLAVGAPPADKTASRNGVWRGELDPLRRLIADGQVLAAAHAKADAHAKAAAWETDLSAIRATIAEHGRSWFRGLNGEYRQALAILRGVTRTTMPTGFAERLAFIDALLAGQKAGHSVRAGELLGIAAFGSFWQQERTEWAQTEAIVEWVAACKTAGIADEIRECLVEINDPGESGRLAALVASQLESARAAIDLLVLWLKLDLPYAFDRTDVDQLPVEDLGMRIEAWIESIDGLARWTGLAAQIAKAREMGLGEIVERLERGLFPPEEFPDCLTRLIFGQLLRTAAYERPALEFDGLQHAAHVSEFRQLDRDRLDLAQARVRNQHFKQLPRTDGLGAAGVLRSEVERKRGHKSVRNLIAAVGPLIQQIKPVFMMSPLSVAQFLKPGAVEFDLLVIDEASQVHPVDALGAVARCKQVVVVGDSFQLSPTKFFDRLTSSDNSDEEPAEGQEAPARDMESILSLCVARGVSQEMLLWHYRSRHHSLIAISNSEFYKNLFIAPSPEDKPSPELGLRFHHVEHGIYDRGKSKTNRIEAREVARAVLAHAQARPHETLGVVAFSIHQRDAIVAELELLRGASPGVEGFFAPGRKEEFFVKNLENVQGDERDVIFISVGYGPDQSGYFAMGFGPLSMDGGERRLNVLISRAKYRCEVFSSITDDDIDLERGKGDGVRVLKAFMRYARTGYLVNDGPTAGREPESPFEEAVRDALVNEGNKVHAQVGMAGFFIDLAVVDPDRPGRYLLGIECDGATYHSARSARDRDRLRQGVLEDHGWTIHRIWSTDWFNHRGDALRCVCQAIARAKAATSAPQSDLPPTDASAEGPREPQSVARSTPTGSPLATDYVVAVFDVPRHIEPHRIPSCALGDIVRRIVEAEGPIHEDEVVARVRDLWRYGRAGSRIQEAVTRAIRHVLDSNVCVCEEGCLFIAGVPARMRRFGDAPSPSLRKPELLPPQEVRTALLALLDEHGSATREELVTAIARLFGFKSTSENLRLILEAQISRLMTSGAVEEADRFLRRSAKA